MSVAPYVGAWIETSDDEEGIKQDLVAPYVGAWIETWVDGPTVAEVEKSHPTWVRGLKQTEKYIIVYC